MPIPTNPIPELTDKEFLRFRYGIDDHEGDRSKCWNWSRAVNRDNRGTLKIRHNGVEQNIYVARIAFKLATGIDPVGFVVAHTCDNPRCCNPDHLFKATQTENVIDKVNKSRQARGRQMPFARLSDEVVAIIRKEYRPWKMGFRKLAERFGVGKSTIEYALKHGWKHVPKNLPG